jgi:DNA-damage-inducible protein D
MGKEELASNLFRITQTEAKIKKDRIHGQSSLEDIAETIGIQVRKAMREMSGSRPEDLPLSMDIKSVKKGIKQTQKKLKEIDKK